MSKLRYLVALYNSLGLDNLHLRLWRNFVDSLGKLWRQKGDSRKRLLRIVQLNIG